MELIGGAGGGTIPGSNLNTCGGAGGSGYSLTFAGPQLGGNDGHDAPCAGGGGGGGQTQTVMGIARPVAVQEVRAITVVAAAVVAVVPTTQAMEELEALAAVEAAVPFSRPALAVMDLVAAAEMEVSREVEEREGRASFPADREPEEYSVAAGHARTVAEAARWAEQFSTTAEPSRSPTALSIAILWTAAWVARAENQIAQPATVATPGARFFSLHGTVTVLNSTIDGNEGTGAGGGIVIYQAVGFPPMPTSVHIENTIIAGDSAGWNAGAFGQKITGSAIGNLIQANDNCPGVASNSDPQLAALALNYPGRTLTMALSTSSPGFNSGDLGSALETDQRGMPRPEGGAPDIGAFELCVPLNPFDHHCELVASSIATPLTRMPEHGPHQSTWRRYFNSLRHDK